MVMVITSYTPETGSVAGGTLVTVTGTGLTVCDVVLVANKQAQIVGTPTATQVKFVAPAGTAGNAGVVLVDTDGNAAVTATDPYVYTAGDTVVRGERLAKTMALDISTNLSAVLDSDFTRVEGITEFKNALDWTTQDNSTFDTGLFGGTAKTKAGWHVDFTVLSTIAPDGTLPPGQSIAFNAHDLAGLAGRVKARWYPRDKGPEAYIGLVDVQWSDKGGDSAALRFIDLSLLGQGTRTRITNPVLANPALAT